MSPALYFGWGEPSTGVADVEFLETGVSEEFRRSGVKGFEFWTLW
jgi:hypothetical protein